MMDSLLTAAARALAAGDPLAALHRVALRDDPPALALRGIAMAQLGDLDRARELLRRAARAFPPRAALARARCAVAEAEIALAARDLAPSVRGLVAAQRSLERGGDAANAAHARLIAVRRLLLLGRVADAERALAAHAWDAAPPRLLAIAELARADVARRRIHARDAAEALSRAAVAADRAGIPMLIAEVAAAVHALAAPAARARTAEGARVLDLAAVEALLAGDDLVVDACRRAVRGAGRVIALARRPVLFAIARVLAEAWPGDAARDALITGAFLARVPNASHRARLRVELGRLRRELRGLADVRATPRGFALVVRAARGVVVLAPPVDAIDSALLALLADGTAWSTSALALAHGSSQRSIQRALQALAEAGQVRTIGRARARRWLAAPPAGSATFATALLLSAAPGAD